MIYHAQIVLIYNCPNPDLEIFIYELPELLNNVIASLRSQ